MRIIIAEPRGFCAGVERAIGIVERVLELHRDEPVYVHHEVVHNRTVVSSFKKRGVVFIEDPQHAPSGSVLIYSAHGVSNRVKRLSKERNLRIYDATCPLVTKVHHEVKRYCERGMEVILIGHQDHPEVIGTIGQVEDVVHLVQNQEDVAEITPTVGKKLGYVMQTTLSVQDASMIVEALKKRFPDIEGPRQDDICYATQNRQDAVRELAKQVDLILVIGSHNSSNSNRLCEIAEQCGVTAHLIDEPKMLNKRWFEKVEKVGITAGASAPESVVRNVVDALRKFDDCDIRTLSVIRENVVFQLPKELRGSSTAIR